MSIIQDHEFAIGESGWEVDWCAELGREENGDINPDLDQNVIVNFRTSREAAEYAKSVLPRDQYGFVRITPFSVEAISEKPPYGRDFVYTADTEYLGNT